MEHWPVGRSWCRCGVLVKLETNDSVVWMAGCRGGLGPPGPRPGPRPLQRTSTRRPWARLGPSPRLLTHHTSTLLYYLIVI